MFKRTTSCVRVGIGVATLALAAHSVPCQAHGFTERVSIGTSGVQGNGFSGYIPAISADGRFVAFISDASNLVPGDSNRVDDVFVRDRQLGTTRRVNVGPDGIQANNFSFLYPPAISADGRFIAFTSFASNLVPVDTNRTWDVFVRDRQKATTRRVSVGPGGVQGNAASMDQSISADGRFIAFASMAFNPEDIYLTDVFVRDRRRGTTQNVSLGLGGAQCGGDCLRTAISANGRFVAFTSIAANLVPDDTNNAGDVFVHDRRSGTVGRVSVGLGGIQGNGSSGELHPAISADGRFVAFTSSASNLVPDDTNNEWDIFVHDRRNGTTRRMSIGPDGVQANGGSLGQAISADGRFVAFTSYASNLVRGDTNYVGDVFVRDRHTATTRRVSLGQGGVQGNSSSSNPAISADGRIVAFASDASNLVPRDTNGQADLFVRVLAP